MQKALIALTALLLSAGTFAIYNFQSQVEEQQDEIPLLTWANGMAVSNAITSIAQPHSTGQCAKYVRRAIQMANNEPQRPTGIVSAKDYGPWVEAHGYHKTSKTYQQATTGDVAILQNSPHHPHGHITIKCSDGHWRSDFVQNSFWIYRDGAHPSYTIYSL